MKISIGARGGLVVSAILEIRSQCQEERETLVSLKNQLIQSSSFFFPSISSNMLSLSVSFLILAFFHGPDQSGISLIH